ncbi:hypothetical protein [Paenibacillus odorifer]|nr:hypothetical protein [Paenibacillus odorifer]
MKKKWLLTGGAAGISGAIMLITGMTAFAGTSGRSGRAMLPIFIT